MTELNWRRGEVAVFTFTCDDEYCGCEQEEYEVHKRSSCSNCRGIGRVPPKLGSITENTPLTAALVDLTCRPCGGCGKSCFLWRDRGVRGTISEEVPGPCNHVIREMEGACQYPWQSVPNFFRDVTI